MPIFLVKYETVFALGSEGAQFATEARGHTALVVSMSTQTLSILVTPLALLALIRLALL